MTTKTILCHSYQVSSPICLATHSQSLQTCSRQQPVWGDVDTWAQE